MHTNVSLELSFHTSELYYILEALALELNPYLVIFALICILIL